MNNSKQPITPSMWTKCGEGADDYQPLKDGQKTGWETKFGGLTKREHIATQVLSGLSANYLRENVTGWDVKTYVKEAVALTDALLEELSTEAGS
jgi:hypothetical protein